MKRNYIFSLAVALLLSSQLFAQVPNFVSIDSLQGFWNFNGNTDNSLSSGLTLSAGGNVNYAVDRNAVANSSLNNGRAFKNSIDGFDATNSFTVGGWVSPFLVTFSSYPSNFIGYFYKMDYEVMQQIGGPAVGTHTQFAFLSDFVSTSPGMTGYGPDYGKLYFQTVIGGNTRILKSAANYTSGVWYHVMASYDQSFLRFYVNGECTDSMAVTGNLDYSNATGNNEWVGFNSYVNHNASQNIESRTALDQMGFWRRALKPCEILNLYEESNTNCESSLSNHTIQANTSKIICYPNPTQGFITIEGLAVGEKLYITGIARNILLEQVIQQETLQLDLSRLASGIYFVRSGNNKPLKINIKQ